MDYQQYYEKIKGNFNASKQVNIYNLDTHVTYEEVFKWKWMATKLKIFTFLTYAEKIDEQLIKVYTDKCLNYALKNKRGLPRGLQNGVVSYSIIASENVDQSAIEFVTQRPQKLWSAFLMPVIVDLSQKKIYYYKDGIVWGALYDSYLKEYLLRKYNI